MKNFLLILTLMAFLLLVPSGSTKAGEHIGVWGKTYKLSTLTKTEVKNFQGEKLGEIEDFVLDAQSGRVGFVIFSHGGISGLGKRVKFIPYSLFVFNEAEKNFLLDVGKEDLIPTTGAKNFQGRDLGKIEDLVIDSWGRILFAVLVHKEKPVMIPLTALSLHKTGNFFILDTNEEKLAAAPSYTEGAVSERQAEETYRYFGQSPYWKEEEEEPPTKLEQLIPLPKF